MNEELLEELIEALKNINNTLLSINDAVTQINCRGITIKKEDDEY